MAEPTIIGTTPPTEEQIPVTVNVAPVRQPHGRHWVKLELVCGNVAFGMVLPPATTERLAEILPETLTHGVDAARRGDLGLHVAPANGQLPPLP